MTSSSETPSLSLSLSLQWLYVHTFAYLLYLTQIVYYYSFLISVNAKRRIYGITTRWFYRSRKRNYRIRNNNNECGIGIQPTTGIFQAPVSGLYVFFYDIECSKTNGNTYVELVRDGARTGVQAYCHGLGDFDNSATLGVLHLGAGDTVWLRLYDVDNRTFGGKTLFSGFLL